MKSVAAGVPLAVLLVNITTAATLTVWFVYINMST